MREVKFPIKSVGDHFVVMRKKPIKWNVIKSSESMRCCKFNLDDGKEE